MQTDKLAAIPDSDEEDPQQDRDSARTQSYISDHETTNENSDYNKYRKRQVK